VSGDSSLLGKDFFLLEGKLSALLLQAYMSPDSDLSFLDGVCPTFDADILRFSRFLANRRIGESE